MQGGGNILMNAEWLSDFRKIPDEVMNYLRRIAALLHQVRQAFEQVPDPRRLWATVFITGCPDVGFGGLWLKVSFFVKI